METNYADARMKRKGIYKIMGFKVWTATFPTVNIQSPWSPLLPSSLLMPPPLLASSCGIHLERCQWLCKRVQSLCMFVVYNIILLYSFSYTVHYCSFTAEPVSPTAVLVASHSCNGTQPSNFTIIHILMAAVK